MEYILGVDFGTTHACARIYSLDLKVIGSSSLRVVQEPTNGPNRELNPERAWQALCQVMSDALANANVPADQIKCVGLCVQRNSLLLWDRNTSKPLTPVITWQDLRCCALTQRLNNQLMFRCVKALARRVCKISPNPRLKTMASYQFKTTLACVRLKQVFDENPELLTQCKKGSVCYGCLETWFLWRLTDGKSFQTDVSCASATGMYDPVKCHWSGPVLRFLGIPSRILPLVKPTSHLFGHIREGPLRPSGSRPPIPVTAIMGDAQAATLAEGCLKQGQAKLTLGTGSFLDLNTGHKPRVMMDGFYPVIGWASHTPNCSHPCRSASSPCCHPPVTYLLEGNHIHTGTTIDWLLMQGFFKEYTEMEDMLKSGDQLELDQVVKSHECFYLPLPPDPFQEHSLGRPKSEVGPDGILVGLHTLPQENKNLAIVRVVVESIALIVKLMLERCQKEAGCYPAKLRANGNVTRSNWLMQRVADITGVIVERSGFDESSTLGIAMAAGVGAGIWPSYEAVSAILHPKDTKSSDPSTTESLTPTSLFQVFRPNSLVRGQMEARYQAWCRARTNLMSHSRPRKPYQVLVTPGIVQNGIQTAIAQQGDYSG